MPRLVDGHRLDQSLRFHGGKYVVDDVRLQVEHGVGVACTLAPQAILVILAIDGQRTLRQLIEDESEGLNANDAEVFVDVAITAVRQLVALGMLELAGVE